MIGDTFVFDGVAHPFNFTPKNAYGKPGEMFANHLYAFHATLTPEGQPVMSAGGVPPGVDAGRHPADGLRRV